MQAGAISAEHPIAIAAAGVSVMVLLCVVSQLLNTLLFHRGFTNFSFLLYYLASLSSSDTALMPQECALSGDTFSSCGFVHCSSEEKKSTKNPKRPLANWSEYFVNFQRSQHKAPYVDWYASQRPSLSKRLHCRFMFYWRQASSHLLATPFKPSHTLRMSLNCLHT